MICAGLFLVYMLFVSLVGGQSPSINARNLQRRINNYEFPPDDPQLFEAIEQLFRALRTAYGNNDNRFVVGGSIATNYWFPDKARTVKDLDVYISKHPATDEEEKDLFLRQAKDKVMILNTNFTLVNQDEMLFTGKQQQEDHYLFVDLIAYISPNKDYFANQGVKLTELPSPIDPKDDRLYADAPALFTSAIMYVVGLGEIEDKTKRRRKMDNMKANLKLLPTKVGFSLNACQLRVVDYAINDFDKAAEKDGLDTEVANFYEDVIDILVDLQKQWGVYQGLRRRKDETSKL